MRTPVAVRVGDTHAVREIGPITQTDIVRFAGAGGDFNPLHHDPEFAARAGFPTVIAMGQFQAGLLAAWLSDWLGVEHLRSYEVRFRAPVFVGDVLHLSGRVDALSAADGSCVATVSLQAARGDVVVVSATAEVDVQAA